MAFSVSTISALVAFSSSTIAFATDHSFLAPEGASLKTATDNGNTCTCTNGTPKTGADCAGDGAFMCALCDEGFTINSDETGCDGLPLPTFEEYRASAADCITDDGDTILWEKDSGLCTCGTSHANKCDRILKKHRKCIRTIPKLSKCVQ